MSRIDVTKTFLPPIEEYEAFITSIWGRDRLTNQGPLVLELEEKLKAKLQLHYMHFVANGTLALQLALKVLDVNEGEVITTPFSYVATSSAILWEKCTPVFVDIDPRTLCIDAEKIEAAITPATRAIMPVHVFGNPCDVEKIDDIAQKHGLKVIYDGAHAFGVQYKGRSLLDYGDISTCSFHATKLFHTVEGGAIVCRDGDISKKLELTKRFGHNGDDHYLLGINAKASEFHAAMGLCNLKYVDELIEKRKLVTLRYDELLGSALEKPDISEMTTPNFGYYPVIFKTEQQLMAALQALNDEQIFPRRYFYPSLNTLPYISSKQDCPISEDIATRILCLPLYPDLEFETIEKIARIIIR